MDKTEVGENPDLEEVVKLESPLKEIIVNYSIPPGINKFNLKLIEWMSKVYSDVELELIRFFEITQFIRMIPFKLAIDPERAKLFYVLACSLSHTSSEYA